MIRDVVFKISRIKGKDEAIGIFFINELNIRDSDINRIDDPSVVKVKASLSCSKGAVETVNRNAFLDVKFELNQLRIRSRAFAIVDRHSIR